MKRLYFLGIGGVAMGSVAIACSQQGFDVSGCDSNVYPPMSEALLRAGINYTSSYDPNHILTWTPDAVIIGNAISRGNPALEVVLNANLPLFSLPELVRLLFLNYRYRIVVSGTHGKTTTTSLLAYLLQFCGAEPGYLIGGVCDQLEVSCKAALPGKPFVIEGDEYDTAFFDKRSKFLHYMPQALIITSIEFDHADIFHSKDDVLNTFRQLLRLVPQHGLVLACSDDAGARSVVQHSLAPVQTYGLNNDAFWQARITHNYKTETQFDLFRQDRFIGSFSMQLVGEHNVRNATVALATALTYGISADALHAALATFKPPRRRFEMLCTWHGAIIIDDFAHHPTAVKATLTAAHQRFPSQRIIACFEPRSNTSARNIFIDEFAEALSLAEIAILCPVYRQERYSIHERLDCGQLARLLIQHGTTAYCIPPEENWGKLLYGLLEHIVQDGDVIILMSNGNIGGIRQLLLNDATSETQTQQPMV